MGEAITYQFEMDSDEWREWTDTIPRSQPLDGRLTELIRQDTQAVAQAERGDVDTANIEMLATRIRIRATQALGAARGDDVDAETAREELQTIIDLATALEE